MRPNSNQKRAVTLIELLIAMALLSMVVIGFSSIDMFSRYHVLSSTRRAKVQNEVSYLLEVVTKKINRAIGNERIDSPDSVIDVSSVTNGEKERIKFYVDGNNNGIAEFPSNPSETVDHWEAYRFFECSSGARRRCEVQYCDVCKNKNCQNCDTGWEVLSNKAIEFKPIKPTVSISDHTLTDNYVELKVTSCWDVKDESTCGTTPDNPTVEMTTRIKLPSVSTN
jgi:prepilin-type N-terminal cleavage/methylation domain-containing protein